LKNELADSIAEAVQMLIDKNLKPYSQHEEWQKWRSEKFWTIDIHDVLDANLDNLKKIEKYYATQAQKSLTFKDIQHLLLEKCDI